MSPPSVLTRSATPSQVNGVPFAPATGTFWPVVSSHPRWAEINYPSRHGRVGTNPSRQFAAPRARGARRHCGVDLYAQHHDPVRAIDEGRIVAFYPFYRGTHALIVAHPGVVVNYGEVDPASLSRRGLRVGSAVRAGQEIGEVGRMTSSSMLHFETYRPGTRANQRWVGRPPTALLNPTTLLLHLRGVGGDPAPRPSSPGLATYPGLDVPRAVARNRYHAARLGWGARLSDVARALGLASVPHAGAPELAHAIARWQGTAGGLAVDGILGPRTWARLSPTLGAPGTAAPYPVDSARPYGPRFRGRRPPGLPAGARPAGRWGGAVEDVRRSAARHGLGSTFERTVVHLATTESGATYGLPAHTFNALPAAARAGARLITAWGVFQFNRPAWTELVPPAERASRPGFTPHGPSCRPAAGCVPPWGATVAEEVDRPVAVYAQLWRSILRTGGGPVDAARGIRLWHRSPAAFRRYVRAGSGGRFTAAWGAVDAAHRSRVDQHLRDAGVH